MPSAWTCCCQRRQVCSVTSCPRAERARPRAIMGKACPGSPKAPSSTRRGGPAALLTRTRSGGELGEQPQLLQALGGGERCGGDAEGADSCLTIDGETLADHLGRPAERDAVDELIGDGGHGLLALAF